MTALLEITPDVDNKVRQIKILVDGKPWLAPPCHTEIVQKQDGLWWITWEGGCAGPLESSQFALAVSQAMRAPPP
jgi:hypothetical protein